MTGLVLDEFDARKKRIHVVAGIIWNNSKTKILVSRRPEHLHMGGYWEFPGGKVEIGETEERALARELEEELGIKFSFSEKMKVVNFNYPEKDVKLVFFHVFDVSGNIHGKESQEWRWVLPSELSEYKFPEANISVVEELVKIIQFI